MSIDVTASAAPITVSASGTKIDANVTGGVGPQGPAGPAGTTTWVGITDKPSTFPPSAHGHTVADVTGLQSALDGKQAAGSYATLVGGKVPESQLPPIVTTWDGLAGKPSTFAPSAHTHDASQITDFTAAVIAAAPPTTNASLLTSGTLPDARLSSNIARTSDVTSAVAAVVNAAPASLDTLQELAAALNNDASFASTVTASLASKAPLASPTFTGTVSGITKSMVGLGNVDNTSDASKPVSTAQAAADAAVASAAAADATTKANAAQAAAVQRANHTGTQDASTIGSGTLDFARLPFTVTYPVRAVHAAGVLSFNNWAVYTTPTYFWGGSAGDLRTLATMEYPATSVSVDVSASATKYIADNPGRTLTYAALEVVLVDAANRIVGWGTTSTNAATGPSNGTGGTSMTLSLFSFPAVSAANWVVGGLPTAGNVTDITPITAYKLCQSRHLDLDRTDWGNIPNKPTFAAVATSGSAADLTGTLAAARLPATAVTAGSYGSASSVATYTVDAAGRLTAAGSTAIAIAAGSVSGLAAVATSGSYADLSNKPTTLAPTAHKSSHATGGSDAISPSDIGAASASHTQAWSTITSTPTTISGYGITDGVTTSDTRLASNGSKGDITVSNNGATWTINAGSVVTADIADAAVTTAKLANAAVTVAKVSATGTPSASNFLRGDGAWATPTASVSAATTTTLGGVIVPASSGLSVDGSGNISAAYATLTQAQNAVSTAASNPLRVRDQLAKWKMLDFNQFVATTASGGSVLAYNNTYQMNSNATANGSALARIQNDAAQVFGYSSVLNIFQGSGTTYWSRPQAFAFRGNMSAASANGVCRVQFGKPQGTTTIGRLSGSGVGIEWQRIDANTSRVIVLAHNGTTLNAVDSGFVVYTGTNYDYALSSDASGGVTLLFNDASFTTTGGPTTGGLSGVTIETTNGGDASNNGFSIYRYLFFTGTS